MKRTLLFNKNSRYLRTAFVLVLTIFTMSTSFGQSRRITGKVTDNAGPIAGASIKVKGSTEGAMTNAAGSYSINVANNAVLTVSFIGYVTQEVNVNGRANINVVLETENQQLQQIVVIGYGTAKRRDVTGSVSSISAAQIEKVPVANVDQALQGRAAGVQVTNNGGAPGSGVTLTIRGVGSFAGTSPLYVVDGYPTEGIGNINPNDIASMDVLKDASSTAIYGNRAANGVIIITTKRGTKNGAQVVFDTYGSIETEPKKYDVLNANEWATLANKVGIAENYDRLPEWSNPSALRNSDWQDYIYRQGYRQNYNLAIRGGGEKTQSSISLGYFDQRGIVIQSWYKRVNLSANLDYTPKSWLKSSSSIKFNRNTSRVALGSGIGSIGNLSKLPPTVTGNKLTDQIDDGHGNYGFFTPTNSQIKNFSNPVYGIVNNDTNGASIGLQAVSSLEATIFSGFKIKTNFGMNVGSYSGYSFNPTDNRSQTQYGTNFSSGLNSYSQSANDYYETLWENTLSYDKSFGLHTINFVGGISQQLYATRNLSVGGNALPNDQLRDIGSIPRESLTNFSGNSGNSALASQFARVSYNFASKYYANATVRRDGSSKFAKGNQYGIFPSGSLMWRIKEESLLKNNDAISDLKLRASYGSVGNQNGIAAFQYLSLYTQGGTATSTGNNGYPFNGVYQPGYVLSFLPNPNLKWETSKQTSIALETAFLHGDLSLIVEYYKKESSDFLLNIATPAQTGFSSATRNVGSIENHGIELTLNYKHAINDFNYNIGLNISTISNKVKRLATNQTYVDNLNGQGFSSTGANNWTTYTRSYLNGPVGTFFGFKADGIFQTQAEIDQLNAATAAKYGAGVQYDPSAKPGDRRFKDLNGDGRINNDDRTNIGSPLPDFYGGLNIDLSYKQFDMNVFFNGSYGNKIFNYMESTLESFQQTGGGVGIQNISREYLQNAWSPTNPSNRYSRITANEQHGNTRPADLWVENGSYLRLKNLQIGYTLPSAIAQKISASKIRFYLSSQNLFTVTNYSGLDPEIGSSGGPTGNGIDVGTYPISKFYTVGLNVTF